MEHRLTRKTMFGDYGLEEPTENIQDKLVNTVGKFEDLADLLEIDGVDNLYDFLMEHASLLSGCKFDETDSIALLDLSVRSFNALRHVGVESISDLKKLTRDDLMNVKGLGKKCVNEVLEAMKRV